MSPFVVGEDNGVVKLLKLDVGVRWRGVGPVTVTDGGGGERRRSAITIADELQKVGLAGDPVWDAEFGGFEGELEGSVKRGVVGEGREVNGRRKRMGVDGEKETVSWGEWRNKMRAKLEWL
jgi:hypothetical protein